MQHCQMIQGYRLERSKLQCIEIIIFPRPFQITQIKEKLRLLLSESFCQLFLKNCRDECSCGLHKCTEWALKCLISMMRREKYFLFHNGCLIAHAAPNHSRSRDRKTVCLWPHNALNSPNLQHSPREDSAPGGGGGWNVAWVGWGFDWNCRSLSSGTYVFYLLIWR